MVAFRFIVYICLVMTMINIISARSRHWHDLNPHGKRLFGCTELGKSCSGIFDRACCSGYKCHSSTGKCVGSNSSGSWLGDRNGK